MWPKHKPLYGVWISMRQRCRNPRALQWIHYGGRGIKICERWDVYQNFEDDMAPRPAGTTLDRIDNDGDYSPGNCRWASQKEQLRNMRITRRVVIEGREYIASELAEKHGVKTDTIVDRASNGLSFEEVTSRKRRVYKDGLALGGLANGKRQRSRSHCKSGHEFTDKNTYISRQGWRRCRHCRAEREANRRLKLKSHTL